MAWWLEGVTSKHFGWVRNPSEAIFSYFFSQGKNQKFFFPGKIGFFRKKTVFYREKSVFIGKNRYLSEKLVIFLRFFYFRFFHPKIFSSTTENRFFAKKSAEKNDFFCPCPHPVCVNLHSWLGVNTPMPCPSHCKLERVLALLVLCARL